MNQYFAIASLIHGKVVILGDFFVSQQKAQDVVDDVLSPGKAIVVSVMLPWEPKNLTK